jgi:AP2 domain.
LKNCVNEYFELEDKYELRITNTKGEKISTYFSKEDYPFISSLKWTFKWHYNSYRIRCTKAPYAGKDMPLILFNDIDHSKYMIDHINRDTLDNRRKNLRVVTRSIDAINAKPRVESKTNIRGVYFRKERPGIAKAAWVCEWSIEGKRHSKSFSVDKYGETQAFELAYATRQKELDKLKI